jgi:hypothetical protein
MNKKKCFLIILMMAGGFGPLNLAQAGSPTLQNELLIYGDEEGFDGPYRPEESLSGEQLKSFLDI